MAATITCRRIDENGEPVWGLGAAGFVTDIDAVAQIILTTVRLLQGEWWEALDQGTPLFQSILGVVQNATATAAAAAALQTRIRSVPYVTDVKNVAVTFGGALRVFSFSCDVDTQFGTLTVSNQPGLQAAVGNS